MKHMIIFLLSIISIIITGQLNTALAKDGALKQRDDRNQELKAVMERIKNAVNNTSTTDILGDLSLNSRSEFDYNMCDIKYTVYDKTVKITNNSTTLRDTTEWKFNLTNIAFAEVESVNVESNSMIYNKLHAKINSSGSKKVIKFHRIGFIYNMPLESNQMTDFVQLRVSSHEQAKELKNAFDKAIKLCADI